MRSATPLSLIAHTPKLMIVIQHSLTPIVGSMLPISHLSKSPERVLIADVTSPGFLRKSHTIVKHSYSNSVRVMFGWVPNALVSM